MDDNELRRHLIEISDRTARIDERTERIMSDIDTLHKRDSKHEERIDELDATVSKHGYVLGAVGFLIASIVAAITNTVSKLVPF